LYQIANIAVKKNEAEKILLQNDDVTGRTLRILLLSAIMKSFPFLISIVLSTLVCGTIALVPSKMSARNKNAQIRLATSKASVVIEEPKGRQKTIPPLSTWKRRLNTSQDQFSIHKFAGFGWWLSSTVIFGAGAMTGFTQLPAVLEPFTYLFLFSTMIQSMSSIPMALQYRRNEPVARRGFISSAITTSSLAFTGYWLSPFGQGHPHPPTAAAWIAALVLVDALYSLTSFGDMRNVAAALNANEKDDKSPKKYSTLISMAPVGLPMNVVLLYHMVTHMDHVRDYFLSVIALNGSTPELVYYASVVTSISVCVGNLAATLYHRKLISKDVENLATIGAIVVTLVFNIRASGSFSS
jgi:hypothetical protein